MPITTMFVISPDFLPHMYCATISSAVSERTMPFAPLAQNLHPIAQPTCVEMHCVNLSLAGIRTVSTLLPSSNSTRSFFVPSGDADSSAITACVIGHSRASVSRRSSGRVVACDQSPIHSL